MTSVQDLDVKNLSPADDGQGPREAEGTVPHHRHDSLKGTQIGKRGGGWWSAEPGALKQVLEGQQINPLVLWVVKVESMPNSDLNDDGNRKYLWRMTVSDGKYYFHDAYLTTQYLCSTEDINLAMALPCEILVLNYCFKVKELPHLASPNRIHVLELLTVLQISKRSIAAPYSQSFRQSLLNTELTSDLISAWLHDQPDVGSQLIKLVTAFERVIDMSKSGDSGGCDYPMPESTIRRIKRGLKRRCGLFIVHLWDKNNIKRQNDAHITFYVTSPYRSKHADTSLNHGFSFSVTGKQLNKTQPYLSNKEWVCNMTQLIDEHKSLLYLVSDVNANAYETKLFPIHQLMQEVMVSPQCIKLHITAFKFSVDAELRSDGSKPVEHVGTYTCDLDRPKSNWFLSTVMLNPRTGDFVFAFDEADLRSHGLYYVRLPSSAKPSKKVKNRVASLQPISNGPLGVQWPGAVTHYIKDAGWLWRHNGEQLITLLQAPDRLYVVIFRFEYRNEDDNASIPRVVNAKFISWFEGDTPPRDQGLRSWPPIMSGRYGPFLIFQAGSSTFDLFCVRLLSRDLDSMHSITAESFLLLKNQEKNFDSLIGSWEQHLNKIPNFLAITSLSKVKIVVIHPGGVMIIILPFWIENSTRSNSSSRQLLLVRCDISSVF